MAPKPPLVTQPTALPTRKLMVGTLVAAITGTELAPALAEVWPQIAPPVLAGPAVTEYMALVLSLLAGLAVGYFVKDRANT
jgi:hypothetical protein